MARQPLRILSFHWGLVWPPSGPNGGVGVWQSPGQGLFDGVLKSSASEADSVQGFVQGL